MSENQDLLYQLKKLLKQKESKSFYAKRLNISEYEVNELLNQLKNNNISNQNTESSRKVNNETGTIESVLSSDDAVGFFPAGLVSRKQNGEIIDLDWKKSFVTQAIDHKRLIVPVFIEGRNSNFFYNFANLRKRLGIKANLEMLFLPDEMFKQRDQTIKVHFSKPFDPSILSKDKTHKNWADLIKKFIYSTDFKDGVSFEDYIKN